MRRQEGETRAENLGNHGEIPSSYLTLRTGKSIINGGLMRKSSINVSFSIAMLNNQRAMVISLTFDFLKPLLHNSKTRNQQDQPRTHSNFETAPKIRSIVPKPKHELILNSGMNLFHWRKGCVFPLTGLKIRTKQFLLRSMMYSVQPNNELSIWGLLVPPIYNDGDGLLLAVPHLYII